MAESTKAPVKSVALPKNIFAVEVKNHELLKLAYESYLAEGRSVSATTKQRGEVSGGGKKPWRQKGTGRARFGSSRNPIWRGGGVVFGPRGIENYTKTISTNSKRKALRQALTLAQEAKEILVKDVKTTGKTNEIAKFLRDNKISGNTLVAVAEKTPELIRASRNLPNLKLVSARYLTVFDILNADAIVLANGSLPVIEAWLGGDK